MTAHCTTLILYDMKRVHRVRYGCVGWRERLEWMDARAVQRVGTVRASVLRAAVVRAAGKMFVCVRGCTWWVAMALRRVRGAERMRGDEARVWGAAGALGGRVEAVEAIVALGIVVARPFAAIDGSR